MQKPIKQTIKLMKPIDFYDELDKLDELILDNFCENDLFDSPLMTWYEPNECDEEYEDDIESEQYEFDCCYYYCSCEACSVGDYEIDSMPI